MGRAFGTVTCAFLMMVMIPRVIKGSIIVLQSVKTGKGRGRKGSKDKMFSWLVRYRRVNQTYDSIFMDRIGQHT